MDEYPAAACSRDQLGRVTSVDALGSFALLRIGLGLTGWLTDIVRLPTVFIVGGTLTVALAVLGLSQSSIRRLD